MTEIKLITIPADDVLKELAALRKLVTALVANKDDGIGEVMTVKEAAKYLGISERALRERIKNKSVPFVKNLQGKIYFTDKYLKQALLAPDQSTIDQLSREMYREFKRVGKQ